MEWAMIDRRDVQFAGDGGVQLSAWLYLPTDRPGPLPAITMAHGFGGTRWHGIAPFAEAFAEAGFAVLLHDHRNFGTSGVDEPHDIDPWRQIADWRYAISFLGRCDVVDPDRIGLWGTSYAGGHAIVLGATDRRLKAVVSQVPTISGFEQGLRRVPPDGIRALELRFNDDDRRRHLGESPLEQAIASADPEVAASYRAPDAVAFYNQQLPDGVWENQMTVRSARAARMYEPGIWVSRVSPTPLLMIVALDDTLTMTDLALAAYERALQPKHLVTISGGHFDPYLSEFTRASTAAIDWFQRHLAA
jgi:fermentation-respiration switch protein FrsA (DUF1100 family)